MANYFTLQKGVAIFDVILYQNHSSLKCQLDLLQFIVGVTAMTEGLSDNFEVLEPPIASFVHRFNSCKQPFCFCTVPIHSCCDFVILALVCRISDKLNTIWDIEIQRTPLPFILLSCFATTKKCNIMNTGRLWAIDPPKRKLGFAKDSSGFLMMAYLILPSTGSHTT